MLPLAKSGLIVRKLFYYVHTHWDREWYQPFEAFRTQLVSVVKKIVDDLESGSLPKFYMDGQSVIFDDVLEIAPSLEPRLKKLMQEGKLTAGPWYVLADQLLVGGESLVRNLHYGLTGLSKFGAPSMLGYSPDTFGHSADLPRILQGFGINSAVVWRGVPLLEMGPSFWWHSPDGSKVLTYHLTHGYYQTFVHEMTAMLASGAVFSDVVAESVAVSAGAKSEQNQESGTKTAELASGSSPGRSRSESKQNSSVATAVDLEKTQVADALYTDDAEDDEHAGESSLDSPDSVVEVSAVPMDPLSRLVDYVLPWVDLGARDNGTARSFYNLIDGALLPIGGDHMGSPTNFSSVIGELNRRLLDDGKEMELVAATLPEFLENVRTSIEQPVTLVQKVEGELRYNQSAAYYSRSYLLYGVLSTRLYLKRANRLSEFKIGRLTEPLLSIGHAFNFALYPSDELDHAWKLLLKNHPHDSICGCSVDVVHREMMTRTEQLNNVLDSLLTSFAGSIAGGSADGLLSPEDPEFGATRLVVFNTSAAPVSAPVYVRWAAKVGELKSWQSNPNIQIVKTTKIDQLFSGWGSVPYYKEVELLEGWVRATDVPSVGYKILSWPEASEIASEQASQANAPDEAVSSKASRSTASASSNSANNSVSVRNHRLGNGMLDVSIGFDGDLHVSQLVQKERPRSFDLRHRLRDMGDGGDSYNFDPIPEDRRIKSRFVSARAGQRGPLVGSLLVTYEIEIPECAEAVGPLKLKGDDDAHKIVVLKRSKRKIKHRFTTEIILKRDIPIVFFETTWLNESADHRLEVLFETGKTVKETFSENHFSVLHREHDRPGYMQKLPVPVAHEAQSDRYPCQRFFIANGQVFLNSGMPEYGVEDAQVSMTMLRAISMLSKPRLWTRGGGAGPNLEIPEANCKGEMTCSYGWAPLSAATGGPDPFAQAFCLAELYEGPLWASTSRARNFVETNSSAACSSLLKLDNPAIRLSSVSVDAEGDMVLRLLNTTAASQLCRVSVSSEIFSTLAVSNLGGGERETLTTEVSESNWKYVELEFGRAQLVTLRLTLERFVLGTKRKGTGSTAALGNRTAVAKPRANATDSGAVQETVSPDSSSASDGASTSTAGAAKAISKRKPTKPPAKGKTSGRKKLPE